MGLGGVLLVSLVFAATLAPGEMVNSFCDYSQVLEPGRYYYVYNLNYPNYARGSQSCRWVAKSEYRVTVTCTTFDLPENDGCERDYLSFRVSNTTTKRYCGKRGSFSVTSEGPQLEILSRNSLTSKSKFLCYMYAVRKIEYNRNCQCGWKNPSRIVGGTDAGVNEFPMMAGLVRIEDADLYCGGTIISDRHILTVAHCVVNTTVSDIAVVVGEHDVTDGRETNATRIHMVQNITLHPEYQWHLTYNDLAIITLKSKIEFNMQVGPACLPIQHRYDSFGGSRVQLLGWGNLEFTGERATVLQKVTVNSLLNADCKQYYDDIVDSKICTHASEKDSCQHDSGSPVLWTNPTSDRLVLVGAISSGDGCAFGPPGVNTRIGAFVDWIVSMTPYADYCGRE